MKININKSFTFEVTFGSIKLTTIQDKTTSFTDENVKKGRRYDTIEKVLIFFIFLIAMVILCSGCKKFVQVATPANEIVSTSAFATDATATSTVLAIYISMMNSVNLNFGNGGITVYTGESADELYPSKTTANDVQFYTNAISSSTNTVNNSSFWKTAYQYIYYANACIDGINNSTSITASTKSQLLGESKFIRAFEYFNMTNLYGPVPLVVTTDYNVNTIMTRTSTDSVYQQIISDLHDAVSLLPYDYATSGRVRPNKYTALALLSKVYLYRGNWTRADSAASAIINSGVYSLEPNLSNVFGSSSNEAIWQLDPVIAYFASTEGYILIPSSKTKLPTYIITPSLLGAFENGDLRRAQWLDSNKVSGKIYYYPYKYNLPYDVNTPPGEFYTVFRLAEQYLIRSEARTNEGSSLIAADSDLNIIRTRAGLDPVTPTSSAALLTAIYHERQIELFCEWGNRWFDLKRTGTIDNVLSAEKTSWTPTDSLYPIPFTQIQTDPSLTQNPGYNQ